MTLQPVVRAHLLHPPFSYGLLASDSCLPSYLSPRTPAKRQALDKNHQFMRFSHESIGQRRKSNLRELELLSSDNTAKEVEGDSVPSNPCSVPYTTCFRSLSEFQDSSSTRPQEACRETLWSHRYHLAVGGQKGGMLMLSGWAYQACLGPRLLARLR